jgi:aldehyde dehydrogenase (NAD+)
MEGPMTERPPGLLIDGEWRRSLSSDTGSVEDPSTAQAVGVFDIGHKEDAEAAIAAARRAFDSGPWPQMSPRDRRSRLLELAGLIDDSSEEIADICVREVGAPRKSVLEWQVNSAMTQFRQAIECGSQDLEIVLPSEKGDSVQEFVVREPRGVVSAIASWNSPHVLQLHQLGPALITGNAMVLKPALNTPTCALHLGLLAQEAGIPPGVVNIVPGDIDVGVTMVNDPRVDMVSFIGSTSVGIEIAQRAATSLKRVLLELGGKSALIAMSDAKLDDVVALATGITWLTGQGCGLITRLVLASSIHDEVVDRVVDALSGIKTGSAHDPETDMGPLSSAAQLERVETYIQLGLDEGASLAIGGERPDVRESGYYIEPTLFTDVDRKMRIAQEEIFGPVLSVIRFDGSPETAVDIANDSQYGLTAGVFTSDRALGLQMARAIKSGRVNVNNWVFSPKGPFGGYKRSGIGRMWGRFGVEEYTEVKNICWS